LAEAGVVVEVGVGAEEARQAHAGHIRRVQDGRPHVILKLAVSADGKAAQSGRRPAAITGEAGRARAHLLRAQSDAVLTGIGTVVADDPLLTSRLPACARRCVSFSTRRYGCRPRASSLRPRGRCRSGS